MPQVLFCVRCEMGWQVAVFLVLATATPRLLAGAKGRRRRRWWWRGDGVCLCVCVQDECAIVAGFVGRTASRITGESVCRVEERERRDKEARQRCQEVIIWGWGQVADRRVLVGSLSVWQISITLFFCSSFLALLCDFYVHKLNRPGGDNNNNTTNITIAFYLNHPTGASTTSTHSNGAYLLPPKSSSILVSLFCLCWRWRWMW